MLGYKWKRARLSLKRKRNKDEFELKHGQIDDLKQLEDSGYIDLYFGDESHFGLNTKCAVRMATKGQTVIAASSQRQVSKCCWFNFSKESFVFTST